MKINKTELLRVMTQCIPGVDKRDHILEGVNTFLFNGNVLQSYNDNISVSVQLPEEFELYGAVKSVDFYKLVNKFKEDETEITVKDTKLHVKNGRSNAKINLLADKISDYIKTLKTSDLTWHDLPEEFTEGLRLCSIASNSSPHAGICTKGKLMISTDMRRLNFYDLPLDMGEFYLSDQSVKELLKFDNLKQFNITNDWAHFKTDTDTIFSCRCMDIEIYPFKSIVKKKLEMVQGEFELKNQLPYSLGGVIDRVGSLSRDLSGSQAVKLIFSKTEITAHSFRDSGEVTESVDLNKPFEEDVNLEIWMDAPFLKEAIEKVPNFLIKKTEMQRAGTKELIQWPVVIFTADNYTQVVATIMPND